MIFWDRFDSQLTMSATQDRKLAQAAAALAAGDHVLAGRLCGDVLERAPRHPRALHLAAAVRLGQGEWEQARELLRRLLEIDPRNLQALEDLGAAELKAGDAVQAESWLRRAIASGRRGAAVSCWLGLALSAQGRHAEAVELFRQATAAEPDNPGWHLNLGNELMQVGAWDEATASYEQVLKLKPDLAEALNGMGSALKIQGNLEQAAARIQSAIALRPDYAAAHDNLGDALLRLGRDEEAVACFQRALVLEPANADYQADLGRAFQLLRLPDKAIAQYEQALRLRPDDPEALNGLGWLLQEQGSLDKAVPLFRQALAMRADYAEAHQNLGCALARLGKRDEADASFRRAIELDPNNAYLHAGFGNSAKEQHRWEEAIAHYQRALAINPNLAIVQFHLALARMFRQEFDQVWEGYEQRLETRDFRNSDFRGAAASIAGMALYKRFPRWRGPGEAGAGEVAIWSEQGLGDQVLFSTLIPELVAAGVSFLYEVDRRLIAAYERAFPGARFLATQEPPREELQRADRVLSVGSLPQWFRRSREDFVRQPGKLLGALPERVAHYRGRIAAQGPGLKVALSWRSTRKDWWVKKKTAPLADFGPLLQLPGVQWVDVQYGDTAQERAALQAAGGARLLRFEEVDYFNDLEEVLAILEACDLLITTSNATAHLAGALGKRTWLLYLADQPPFHYWAHGGSYRSLWYPSVEIVTAAHLADWRALASHTAEKLRKVTGEQ